MRNKRPGIRGFAAASAFVIGASLASPVAAVAAPAPPAAPTAEKPADQQAGGQTPAEAKALAEAQRTGQPVEVTEQLTENTTVLVNPNGTTTMRSHAQPVRVKQDGAWKGVDTKLKRNPDGTLAPIAAAAGMTFSGGGTTPLVTLSEGAKQVALSWPAPLPAPVVEGASATYPNVFPGVDLQVTAGVIGYSEVLVVHSAEAAKNPALTAVKLRATATGVTLESNADGVLSAKDADGRTVFQGSTPVMWDSTVDSKVGSKPNAVDPGSGRLKKLKVTTSAPKQQNGVSARSAPPSTVEVQVSADVKDLTGPDVKYPLYIDPVMSRYSEAWAEVTDNGWHYWNANMFAQVGYCSGWSGCGGSWRARSFFRFNVSAMKSRGGKQAHVFEAYFYANQVHGTQCGTKHPVALYQVNGFDQNTRWPGPWGFERARESSDAGDQCGGARDVRFNIIGSAYDMVNWNSDQFNFGLISPDENNNYQWKKFANNPHLDVVFSFPPGRATNTGVSNAVTCGGRLVTPDAHPTLYATSYDNNDPPLNLGLWYEVWDSVGSKMHARSTTATGIASGSTGAWPVDTNLANGDWAYRVATENSYPGDSGRNLWNGEWSDWTWFTTRGIPVTQVPTITSEDYPKENWGRQQDMPGTFTFNAAGAEHIVGFTYTFNGPGTSRTPTNTECDYNQVWGNDGGWVANNGGTATITVPRTLSPGFHTIHVRSFNDAHRPSPESQAYTFYVAPTYVAAAPKERLEDDFLHPETTAGTVDYLRSSGDQYSGGRALEMWLRGDSAVVDTMFMVRNEGVYDLTLGLLGGQERYGKVTYELDGRPVGRVSESWTPTSEKPTTRVQSLGGRYLTKGEHKLKIKIDKNPGSTSTPYSGFDYLELTPTVQQDAELMPVLEATRGLAVLADCCSTKWRGGGQLRFEGDSVDQYFSLQINAPIEADYAIGLGLTKAFHYGKYTISVDGKPLAQSDTTPIDAYHPTVIRTHQSLGGTHLTPGPHKITFRVVGTNDASTDLRYRLGVDYLTVQPINNVTTTSFSNAMNNRGIGDDTSNSDAVLDMSNGSLSAQALAAAGLAPGKSAVIGGAKFTMPARNGAGFDNVVAIGQTIPFPDDQKVKANAVGLLVASTCGTVPAISATVTYENDTVTTPMVPEVWDWASPHHDRKSIELPYRNVALQPTSVQPDYVWRANLYPVFLPVDPNRKLKSITLPNYGTDPLPRACKKALHVFAMAPRTTEPGWVGAWSAPSDAPVSSLTLQDKTVRMIVKPSVTGSEVRVQLSNAGVTKPVTIGAASIAAGPGTDASSSAPTALKFGGSASVTLPANGEVLSDPIPAPAGSSYVVSVHLPTAPDLVPVHEGVKSYLASGNQTADASGAPFTTTLPGTYFLSRVDVKTGDTSHGTVAVVGDQLSAGPPGVATWTDLMPSKLVTAGVTLPGGLVNESRNGISDRSRWRLNEGSGTTAKDASGRVNLTAAGGVAWNGEQNGAAVFTNGVLAGTGPALDSKRSYSVSAWVKLNKTGQDQMIVSQSGANNVSFALAYLEGIKSFAFITSSEDKAPATAVPAAWAGSGESPVNTWTHLLGTFDAATGEMRFYLNGQLAGREINRTAWNGTGPITIGGAKRSGGAVGGYFDGAVADVRVQQHTLSARDAALVHAEPHNRAYGPYANNSGVTAGGLAVALERSTLNAPGLRTIIVATGAPDLLRGVPASQVRQDLTMALKANSPYGAKRTYRPDGTPLHVILTTVPPLNLDPADPREQQRRELNSQILSSWADFGADDVVDFDAAVRSSSSQNRIDDQYLTNGTVNQQYHDRLATTMAEACADFPPRAEL